MKPNPSSLTQVQGFKMKLSNFLKSIFIVMAAAFAFANTAMAQSTILVVDQARVLRDSDVGKHVQRQITSIGKQMETEMKSKVTPMISERDRLMAELKNMSADALKSRPDLQQRAKSLQDKGSKSKIEAQYMQRELQITEQKALVKINTKLEAILKAIVAEKSADIIVDRSLIIFAAPNADITDTVISRLNSQMRTVSVIRERLPRKALTAKGK